MNDYLLENKLKKEDPELHSIMKNGIFAMEHALRSFQNRFPSFTDHSMLHSLNVLNYCNQIIGSEGISRLNAPECYILIMACYLHDIGMGVSPKDYSDFAPQIVPKGFFDSHPQIEETTVIRKFHHEFSAFMIRKYAGIFEMPEDYIEPVIQVSRGHRKTDLFDAQEFPILEMPSGPIRLPYLAAILRLADEIDVGADRNPMLLYENIKMITQKDYEAFNTHNSIPRVDVSPQAIILRTKLIKPEFKPLVEELAEKIRETLAYCREASLKRTGIPITQERVEVPLLTANNYLKPTI